MSRRPKKAGHKKPHLYVSVVVKDAMTAWFEQRHKPNQSDTLDCILKWFLTEPDSVQNAVLGMASKDMRNEYATTLRRLADDVETLSVDPRDRQRQLEELASRAGKPLPERR